MKINQFRRDCYDCCCWKIGKGAVTTIRNISFTASSSLDTSKASPGGKHKKLHPFPYFRGQSNHRLNLTPSALSMLSTGSFIGAFTSFIHFDCTRNSYKHHQETQRSRLRIQLRFHSSDIDDHADSKNPFYKEHIKDSISENAAGILTLEKAAFASKQIVEQRFVQSVEMVLCRSSTATERKKMHRFLFPQMQKAAKDLLGVTRDAGLLSDLIEIARENKGYNTSAEISLRELHSSFLQLTQIVLDNLDVAMESENDQCEVGQENFAHSLQMLEIVLSLSYRTHELGLAYHRPLYQQLGLVVARHPMTVGQIISSETSTTLGSLTSQSRAEWIQTIHRWLLFDWSSDSKVSQNQNKENESRISLVIKHDVKWFYPFLKVLAADGRWPDVYHILVGLLRPDPEPVVAYGDYHNNIIDGFTDDDDDQVVITSEIRIPYLDEDLVFDLLVPMNRQGLFRDLWNKRRSYPLFDLVVENIIVLIEPSIWKIFYAIPNHLKATVRHEDDMMDCTVKYSLQDAIGILLKRGPTNLNEGHHIYDDGLEDLLDEEEDENFIQALDELEDILDEHLDVENFREGDKDEMNQMGLDAIALATTLANKIRHEGVEDNRTNNSGDSNSLNVENVATSLDESESRVGRSYSEHIIEITSLNEGFPLDHLEGEEYLDLIYDDRAVDYEDNVPDITKEIYQSNGNQQLRYSTALEHQIFEGLQRPNLHYENEDDVVF